MRQQNAKLRRVGSFQECGSSPTRASAVAGFRRFDRAVCRQGGRSALRNTYVWAFLSPPISRAEILLVDEVLAVGDAAFRKNHGQDG